MGSGAGGATTAATLAGAGVRTLVLEEGPAIPAGSVPQFSQEQMRLQYRNRGQSVAFGAPPVAYAEGRCLGGSTEINSGLYHAPSPGLLQQWAQGWQVSDLSAEGIAPISRAIEKNLNVTTFPQGPPPASQFLCEGAARLDWRTVEVPRWFDHTTGLRQSMSVTYLRQAQERGAEIRSGMRVVRLEIAGNRAVAAEVENAAGHRERVTFDRVFICGGAVQSPALLQRSGVRRHIGASLSMHPMVKAVAFSEQLLNDPHDVPVTQVREFAPDMTLGGSATDPALLALALIRTNVGLDAISSCGPHAATYYAAIRSEGAGRVRTLPRMRDPLVTFRIPGHDMARLRAALGRLLLLLLAAGSESVVPSVVGGSRVTTPDQIPEEVARLSRRRAELMTVHVCSSIPMGEDRTRCAVDSYGASHDVQGVLVNDASILNGAPGINPQGTVMALAIRNAEQFLIRNGAQPPVREFP